MTSSDTPLKPLPETTEEIVKKSKGMTRKDFGNLLKHAFAPPAPKPAPKST